LKNIVKHELERRKVTQTEFAKLMGVTQGTVSKWISGQKEMSRQSKMLLKLSNFELRKIEVEKEIENESIGSDKDL